MAGIVEAILLCDVRAGDIKQVNVAILNEDKGIVGDRYELDVTLIEQEQIDHFNQKTNVPYSGKDFRRNIVTRGIALNELVGKEFQIGFVRLKGIELCEPCAYLSAKLGPEIMEHMIHKSGLRAQVINGGEIKLSDGIYAVHDEVINTVRHWLESMVVGLNLCPFAKRELVKNRIRFVVSEASTEQQLLTDLQAEFNLLDQHGQIETTLLIHPKVLQDFYQYNQFLGEVDELVNQLELEGVYQVASLHPNYQFSGSEPADVENYTNRSPYAMLHLIREASLERAIANYPNPEGIPERNIQLMKSMGIDKVKALLQVCFDPPK